MINLAEDASVGSPSLSSPQESLEEVDLEMRSRSTSPFTDEPLFFISRTPEAEALNSVYSESSMSGESSVHCDDECSCSCHYNSRPSSQASFYSEDERRNFLYD